MQMMINGNCRLSACFASERFSLSSAGKELAGSNNVNQSDGIAHPKCRRPHRARIRAPPATFQLDPIPLVAPRESVQELVVKLRLTPKFKAFNESVSFLGKTLARDLNIPGGGREKRWQDIHAESIDAGEISGT